MRIKFPFSLLKSFIYFLLLISVISVSPVTGMTQQKQINQTVNLEQAETVDTHQVYIPYTMQRHYVNQSVWHSPFSISIAALHELFPSDSDSTDPFPSLIDAFLASGAAGTRVEVKWSEIQPNAPISGQAVYNWSWYDRSLGLIGRSGIQMLVTIEAANAWAVDPGLPACGPISSEHMVDFVNFVQALVTRYKEQPYNVKFWEIDNEPDSIYELGASIGQGCFGIYPQRYADMLSMAKNSAIKAVDPQATVVMGGLAYDAFTDYDGGKFERYFADDVMEAGGGDFLDIQNIHYFTDFRLEWERWNSASPTCEDIDDGIGLTYYAGGIDVIAKANHYKNRMLVCHGVDKPLWITEIAASSGRAGEELPGNHDLDWQARYVPQVYTRALSVGVGNISWYGLTTPNQQDEQGLLFDDRTPKPSFFAYQTMTRQLSGFKYHHTLSDPGIEGYAFQSVSGVEKLVLWKSETNSAVSVDFNLSPAARVLIVDYLGNTNLVLDGGAGDADGIQNGVIRLQITEKPVYLTKNIP